MKTIKLAASWSHHTIAVTTDYQAGAHDVSDEVYTAAVKARVHTEEGESDAEAGPPRATRKAKG